VSSRSGGENFSGAGCGDDLSVEFTRHTLDGSTDPDLDTLHSVLVFLGDATGPFADGERYELTLAEEELVGSAPVGRSRLSRTPSIWTPMRRHRPTARPRSTSTSPAEQASGGLGPARRRRWWTRLRPESTFVRPLIVDGR
jgi:hypothetical protein